MGPTWVLSYLGLVIPRWAPCRPHEPCYLGYWSNVQSAFFCLDGQKLPSTSNGLKLPPCRIPEWRWLQRTGPLLRADENYFLIPGLPEPRVNSLWPSDAIQRPWIKVTIGSGKACCLMAPSHYLNQCWLIITKVLWCSSESNFAWDITAISH